MVYGTPGETRLLTELVHDYPALWKDEGSVDIPVDEWMKLPLRSDWELKVSRKANVYPVGLKDPQGMDTAFDEMHRQGKLSWTKVSTPLSFPMFVV